VAAEWLERRRHAVVKGELEERTWVRDDQTLRKYALPAIGDIPLARLEPRHVVAMYEAMSAGTARRLHACVHQLLRWALRERWIGWDVAAMVTPPRYRAKRRVAILFEDAALILAAFRGTRWFPLVAVAYATGLRQGELLGLRWEDVDWTNSVLWVRQALKKPGQ